MLYVWQRRVASQPHASVCSMYPYRKYHHHHICYHQTKEDKSHIVNITTTTRPRQPCPIFKSCIASLGKFFNANITIIIIMAATNWSKQIPITKIPSTQLRSVVLPRHASSNINTINSQQKPSVQLPLPKAVNCLGLKKLPTKKNNSSLNM